MSEQVSDSAKATSGAWVVGPVMLGMTAIAYLIPALAHPNLMGPILHSTGLRLMVAMSGGLFVIALLGQRVNFSSLSEFQKKCAGFGLISAILLLLYMVLVAVLVHVNREAASLQQHGARATAQVLDIYQGACRKHGCDLDVRYRFTAPNGVVVTDDDVIGDTWNRDAPDLLSAQQTGVVPVAYDLNARVSRLNYGDWVFKCDHEAVLRYLFGMVTVAFALPLGFTWYMVFKAKRQ